MRPAPSLATAAALVLALTACTQGGGAEESRGPTDEPAAGGLLLPDVDTLLATPVHWESGILEVFDDVAAFTPEIAELRDAFVAEEARYAEDLSGRLQEAAGPADPGDPEALALPGLIGPPFGPALPSGSGGHGLLGTTASGGVDASLGANFMVGAMAPEMVNLGFTQDQGWVDRPVGETVSDGKGQSVTKIDENNASVEMASQHQEVKNDTIVRTDFRIKMEGTMCPAPDGNFDVTITVDQTVTATTRAGEAWEHQNVIVNAAGRLGEDAIPERYDVETAQTTTQKHTDGRTGYSSSIKQRNDLNFREMANDASTVIGQSGLTQAELDAITKQGDSRAVALATGQMFGLFKHWLLGGCVQIKHDAPGQVEENSTTDITIETPHRVSKGSVRSKVMLTLAGEKSIDPQELTSPDTFQYTAGEDDTKATIKVKATSRQGGDQQTIAIKAKGERAYIAIGGSDGYTLTEKDHVVICDLDAFAIFAPGHNSATDQVVWAFQSENIVDWNASFGIIKGTYVRSRLGSWEVIEDEDGKPTAVTASYSEGADIFGAGTQNADYKELGGGSAHFDLKPIARPKECDNKG